MTSCIHVERDPDGLQMAVRSLLEEALIAHRMESALASAGAYELERLEAEIPTREISPGYFTRADYLLDISSQVELGIPMDPASLTHHDILGIRAVRSARAEFVRAHPGCPRCGERQDNPHMRNCYACNFQIRGDA